MPSTYTLNNGIELIGTGEQSGTWGDTTNTNLELLDTALDGQVTVTLASAGTSGSPNDLPISDGAASNGRNRMVIFNDGADLGATAYVQLTPNDAEKIIYVRNDLSGSRSIILFQGTYSASNDYELPAGTTAVIYFDGAGSGAVAANVFNNAYFDSLRLGSVSVTAIIDDDTMATASATNIATSESIKAYVDTQVGANNELSEVLANGNTTGGTDISVSSGDDITFADSSKAIFGAGSDLQIYHDGTHSYVTDEGTGALYLRGAGYVYIQKPDGTQSARFDTDGAVALFHNNAEKFSTLSTGVDITGTVVSDGVTSSGVISAEKARSNTAGDGQILISPSDTTVEFAFRHDQTDNKLILDATSAGTWSPNASFNTNKDIIFYDTSGNASFVYDESAGSTFNEQGDNKDFRVESNNNSNMLFVNAGDDEVVIGSSTGLSSAHLTITSSESDPYSTGTINTGGGLALYKSNNDQAALESVGLRFRVTNNNGSSNADGAITYVIKAAGDHDGFMAFQTRRTDGTRQEQLRLDSASGPVFNQDQLNGFDFKVKTSGNANMLFVDGANDRVGIGTTTTYGTLTVDGSISNTGTYDGAYYYSPYEIPVTSVASNSPRYIILARTGSSGRFINGTIYGARSTASSATRSARYDVAVAVNSSGTIQHANVTQYGYPPSNVVEVRTFTYDTVTYVGLYIGTSSSSAYPTGYYFEGIASSIGEVRAIDDSLATSVSDYGGTVGYTGLRNQSLIVYDKSTTLNENGDSGGDFRVESGSNSNMLFVDAGNDQVGVGTASFSGQTLTVNKSIRVHSYDSNDAFINFGVGSSAASPDQLYTVRVDNSESDAFEIDDNTNANEFFRYVPNTGVILNEEGVSWSDFRVEGDTNNAALFVDAGNNRVGILNSSPDFALDVGPTNAAGGDGIQINATRNATLRFLGNDTSMQANEVTGRIEWYTSDTNAPGIHAQILTRATNTNASGEMQIWSGTAGTINKNVHFRGDQAVFNEDSNDMDFRIEGNSRSQLFFIDANDDQVFIGNNTEGGSNVRFNINSDDSGTIPFSCYRNYNSTSGALFLAQSNYNGGSQTTNFQIKTDGDCENTNNNYGAISDERVKQQIADASDQWDDIKALQIRKYKLNGLVEHDGDENTPFHLGVIAQELEAAGLGGLVKTDDETGMKSVKYTILYMKAVKALQEAITKIEDLEARIAALET